MGPKIEPCGTPFPPKKFGRIVVNFVKYVLSQFKTFPVIFNDLGFSSKIL